METIGLIGDIGATHARLGRVVSDNALDFKESITDIRIFRCKEFETIEDLISYYLALVDSLEHPGRGVIAIAAPVDGDHVYMPNLGWQFSQIRVTENLGFNTLVFVNDFEAQAHGIRKFTAKDRVQVGPGEPVKRFPIAVLGPGSGLGMAGIIPSGNQMTILSSEGGHAGYSPGDEMEVAIFRFLMETYGRISNERLLSGQGIENLYKAVLHIHDVKRKPLAAYEITANAISDQCFFCRKSLDLFCAILGSVAGDIALIMGAKGGVYLTGGIVPRFLDFLKRSEFRNRFEDKGRFSGYLNQIPTYVVTAEEPGLLGAKVIFDGQNA
ncbi:MAG: glucokinase [Proteobacteria bacterium]|nr:glucokinase [Pseudomonadota bacterium]